MVIHYFFLTITTWRFNSIQLHQNFLENFFKTVNFQSTIWIFSFAVRRLVCSGDRIINCRAGSQSFHPRSTTISLKSLMLGLEVIVFMNPAHLTSPSKIFSLLEPLPLATFRDASRTVVHSVRWVHAVASILYFCNILSMVSVNLAIGLSLSNSVKWSEMWLKNCSVVRSRRVIEI